jgi:hypothetical protein
LFVCWLFVGPLAGGFGFAPVSTVTATPATTAFMDGRTRATAQRSEAAEVDRPGTRATAALDETLATVGGRTAVVTVMAGDIVPIAGLRRCR